MTPAELVRVVQTDPLLSWASRCLHAAAERRPLPPCPLCRLPPGRDWPWGPCTCRRGGHRACSRQVCPALVVKPRCDFCRLHEPGRARSGLVWDLGCAVSVRAFGQGEPAPAPVPSVRPWELVDLERLSGSGVAGCQAFAGCASARSSPARRPGAHLLLPDGRCLRLGGLEASFWSRLFVSGDWQLVT